MSFFRTRRSFSRGRIPVSSDSGHKTSTVSLHDTGLHDGRQRAQKSKKAVIVSTYGVLVRFLAKRGGLRCVCRIPRISIPSVPSKDFPGFSSLGATGDNLGSAGSAPATESNPAIAGFASANSQQTISVATDLFEARRQIIPSRAICISKMVC
ncbi:protein of unknown function [Paraburkholderia dioscoreae]|uniref:Uncharacterized protein n=1 Tax=Paraburkholderia dioscoreae TaxID=2604047 RepID=A0A5Q4ZK52_9BURK|nr:protein of unknown function [Paraburkholderia dioscoreae]